MTENYGIQVRNSSSRDALLLISKTKDVRLRGPIDIKCVTIWYPRLWKKRSLIKSVFAFHGYVTWMYTESSEFLDILYGPFIKLP
jgi:hypothetical protein